LAYSDKHILQQSFSLRVVPLLGLNLWWGIRPICWGVNPLLRTSPLRSCNSHNDWKKLSARVNEWASDCCLTQSEHLFCYIMARTSYFLMRWWWFCFVLGQNAEIDSYRASSLITVHRYTDSFIWTTSSQPVFFSYSLILLCV